MKHLRRQGLTPAVVYGHGFEPLSITLDTKVFSLMLPRVGKATLLQLQIGEAETRNALIREVQRHPVTQQILHVDFYAVRMDETTKVDVPIHLVGESPAAKMSEFMLLQEATTIQVESLPGNLPRSINVDVTGLTEPDQVIHIRDLELPEGVQLLSDPDSIVVKVHTTKAAFVEDEAAEAAVAAEATAEAAEAAEPAAGGEPAATEEAGEKTE